MEVTMSRANTRMHILEMIESGAINADEGVRLLQDLPLEEEALASAAIEPLALETPTEVPSEALEPAATQATSAGTQEEIDPPNGQAVQGEVLPNFPASEETQRWRAWWMIPFWVGVAITVASGGLLYWAVQAAGVGLGFFLALIPFLAGVALMILTWQARTARWLHLRIHQRAGQSPQMIAISFPLPLRLAIWFLRIFQGRLPSQMGKLDHASLETLIQSLENSVSANTPFYMEVQDDEDGERVEIFIG
jgi:hypothetical protein